MKRRALGLRTHIEVLTSIVLLAGVVAVQAQARQYARTAAARFFEDSVAGVVMGDPKSGAAFVKQHGPGKRTDDGLLHHRYISADGTQVLDLILHPGTYKNQFNQVDVRRATPKDAARLPHLTLPSFASAKGTVLGMTMDALLGNLGPPRSKRDGRRGTVLVYGPRDKQGYAWYEARYRFVDGVLVEFMFGYPYP